MSRVYITGDTHSRVERFNTKHFPEQKEMTRDDCVIVCGDFGLVWAEDGENSEEKYWLDWLDEKNFTLLFIDGNHDNFDRLYQYPVKEWHGGLVHEIRPHVLHLMRGEIYEIGGKTFFAFGGARSHDIDGGILDIEDFEYRMKKRQLDNLGIPYRINHISWWAEELSSDEERQHARDNLAKHNNEVDFILTHCCSSSTQALLNDDEYKPDVHTDFLDEIKQSVKYDHWYFGHYHAERSMSDKETLLYHKIIRII